MGAPEGSDRKEFIARIGTFFVLIGIGLLIFFFLSEVANKVTFGYFCWGLVLLIVGLVFRSQLKKVVTPSGRFSVLKRFKSQPPPKPKDQGKK